MSGRRRGDHEPGQDRVLSLSTDRVLSLSKGHHSIPRWPFWPSSKGCLILVISVTSWAISSSLGSARRPVMITCCWPGRVGQGLHHVVDVDPAPVDRIGELVQHVDPVGLGGQPALDLLPALGRRRGMIIIAARLARPGPTRAHLVPLDRTARPGAARAARPAFSSAVCSPIRHLADLTNWKTPTDQPWFQPRRASPKAAVDFPLPSPVWMISSGRLRRCRVVSPSAGTWSGWPSGIRRPVDDAAGRAGSRCYWTTDEHWSAATSSTLTCWAPRCWLRVAARPRVNRPVSQSITTEAMPAGPQSGRRPGGTGRTASGPKVARPSVTRTSRGRRRGSRMRSSRRVSAAQTSPSASGVRPPLGSSSSRRAATSTEDVGRQRERGLAAPEGDQPDLVAPLVGVEQQRHARRS